MTQSNLMPRRGLLFLWAAGILAALAPMQATAEDFSIDGAHPRLLLTSRRSKLLKRECERQSMRWLQLEAHAKRGIELPEEGFTNALRYVASGDPAAARRAIEWALEHPADPRQAAIVFDWCLEELSGAEREHIAGALLAAGKRLPESSTIGEVRGRLMAAVAAADESNGFGAAEMQWVVEQWWRGQILPALKRGENALPRENVYELLEILHVVRDNLDIDLRTDSIRYFTELPAYLLLTYYPAVYPAPENEYHIPVVRDGSEPDVKTAALARAADLALVALDPNATETQFLQGWAMQDSFLMRSTFAIPYEFLWANPYHPGLSYYSAPRILYDPVGGRLLARSDWDGDALWFYYEDGVMQTFSEGGIQPLNWETFTEALNFGGAIAIPMRGRDRLSVTTDEAVTFYLLGMEPGALYDIEVDDEELFEARADRSGILVINFPAGRKAGVRLRKPPLL